jgi:hypothetical protein
MARKCLFFVQWGSIIFVDVIGVVILYIEAAQRASAEAS